MEDNGLVTAIENVIWSVLANANVCMPGKVESYSFSEQKANIQPLIKRKYKDGSVESYPVLTNVPVKWLRTARSGVVFPLQKGDGVLIVFIQRSTERWRSSEGEEVEPADSRKFDLSDAVALPGLYTLKQENIAQNNEDLLIKHEGQSVTIKKSGDIEVGNSSLKKLLNDGFKSLFDSHVHNFVAAPAGAFSTSPPAGHTVGTPPSPTPTPPTPAPFTIAIGTGELTSKVKAQ